MRSLRFLATSTVALLALGASVGQAGTPWSSAASAGLAFTGNGVGSGGWVDLLHALGPNWSIGAEVGYAALPGQQRSVRGGPLPAPYEPFWYVSSPGEESSMLSASGVIRARSRGPLRVHVLGSFGYYDLTPRAGSTAQDEREGRPGLSLGFGVSGSGLVAPAFQLRWHQVLRPHNNYTDIVSFEAGLLFN